MYILIVMKICVKWIKIQSKNFHVGLGAPKQAPSDPLLDKSLSSLVSAKKLLHCHCLRAHPAPNRPDTAVNLTKMEQGLLPALPAAACVEAAGPTCAALAGCGSTEKRLGPLPVPALQE